MSVIDNKTNEKVASEAYISFINAANKMVKCLKAITPSEYEKFTKEQQQELCLQEKTEFVDLLTNKGISFKVIAMKRLEFL